MKQYTFEYTDSRFMLVLVGIFIAILVALLSSMRYIVPAVGINMASILTIGLPALVVWLLRKRLKKYGLADVDTSSVKFDFGDRVENIDFVNLKSYKIEHYNGTTLILNFADRKNLRITANNNFCDSKQFELFCRDLEEMILESNQVNASEVARIGSVFEQKWMLPFLVFATTGIAWVFIHSFMSGKGFPKSIYTSVAIFMGLWLAYFKAQQKK